jgi:phospholipid/cholesterol/gamma-HCH transport system ATP-binding protein
MNDALNAVDIRFSFGDHVLLKGISFSVGAGGMMAIAGRSGCGKSTLLEICASLRSPDGGKILWDGVCVADLPHHGLVNARQRIGYVFQKHALIHNFTVFDNIALPLRYHRDIPERDVRTAVRLCMEELGLFNVDKKFPNELSAGQSRCAAIARALVMGPSILFLDEPTAGVDPVTAEGITGVLKEMNGSRRIAIVMLCNNVTTIKRMQCTVKVLDKGGLFDVNDPAMAESGAMDIFSILRETL